MSVGRYVLVLHSALRLWKVFYVLLSKTRTPGQGREVSRVSIVRGSRRGPTAHKIAGRALIFFFRWGTDSYEE